MTDAASRSRASLFRPDLQITFALVALALVALRPLLMPISPHDFWWHLAQGRRIALEGAVPHLDFYSYTQNGQPFFNQMWLAQWLWFKIYALGGLALVVFAQAVIITASYGLLLWAAARRAGSYKIPAALLLLGVMPTSFDNWLVRPQSFALPCFAVFVAILTLKNLSSNRRWLWLLPVLEIFWANAHGSFLLGVFMVGLALLGEAATQVNARQIRRGQLLQLFFITLLCGAAIFVNPRGAEVLDYVRFVLNTPQTRLSSEWLPPDYKTANGLFFAVFFAFYGFALVFWRRKISLRDVAISLPFALQALREGRSIIWFAMAAFPVLCAALAPDEKSEAKSEAAGSPAFNWVLILFVWLLPLGVLPWWKPSLGLPPAIGDLLDPETPVGAVRALQKVPTAFRPRRLWHDEATGSYLIWAAPEQKVFNDTRFEFYPQSQWQDAINLRYAQDAPQIIARYGFDGFLLHRERHAKLISYLQKTGGWREVYRDRFWVLWVKAKRAGALAKAWPRRWPTP